MTCFVGAGHDGYCWIYLLKAIGVLVGSSQTRYL